MPDFDAPAPPQKRHGSQSNGAQTLDDEVFVLGVYDHPPAQRAVEDTSSREASDLYKVPPVRPSLSRKLVDDDGRDSSYDVPPPPRGHSPRSSLNTPAEPQIAAEASGRPVTPTENYDYPPPRRDHTVSSDGETPPARPPKPGHRQSPYQNLPPTGSVSTDTNLNTVLAPPKFHSPRQTPGYDVPRSSSHHLSRTLHSGSSHVNIVPPRPSRYNLNSPSSHTYLNTHNKPGSSELYLAPKSGSDGDQSADPADLGAVPPVVPPPRIDSSGDSQSSRSASPSIYQFPPSSTSTSSATGALIRPPARPSAQGPSLSPRNVDAGTANNQSQG